jgi:hypothetical protein
MLLTVILTAICLISANVALYFIVKRQLSVSIRSFLVPRGENQSEFAELIGIITDQGASKTAQCLKAVFMGQNSVNAKNSTRLETALTTDLVSQQAPLLGMGMSMFPQLQKLVTKNPGALQMLTSFMQGQGKAAGDGVPGDTLPGNGKEPPVSPFSL